MRLQIQTAWTQIMLMSLLTAIIFCGTNLVASQLSAESSKPIPFKAATWAEKSPVIDGVLEDECWKAAEPIKDFWLLDGSGKVDDIIRAQICYDADNIYISCRMRTDKTNALSQGSKTRDEGAWFSPNVQIFVKPTPESPHYDFIVNSLSTQEDNRNGVSVWSANWQSAVFVSPDVSYWQVEIAIPFAIFDFSEGIGREWRINFTSSHNVVGGKPYILTWGPAFGNFYSPQYFGKILFDDEKLDLRKCGLNVKVRPDLPETFKVSCEAFADSTRKLGLTVEMKTPKVEIVKRSEMIGSGEGNIAKEFTLSANQVGLYEFLVRLTDAKTQRVLSERLLKRETDEAISIWFDKSLYATEKEAQLHIKSWNSRTNEKYKAIIKNAAGNFEKTLVGSFGANSSEVVRLSLDEYPAGAYDVAVYVGDSNSQQPAAIGKLKKVESVSGTVAYDDKGILYKNGEPFFPVGMYYIKDQLGNGLLEEYVKAGFNTIVLGWTNDQGYVTALDELGKQGINLLLEIQNESGANSLMARYDSSNANDKADIERQFMEQVAKIVKTVAASKPSNLLGWYVRDEPTLEVLPFVKKTAQAVSDNDLRHPTLVVPCHSIVFKPYAGVVDMLMPDAYPGFPGGAVTKVSDFIDAGWDATKGRKPVMIALQSFHEPGAEMPSCEELRCMTYLSIVHKASGIFYFSYSYNGPMREKFPNQWTELKKLASEIKMLGPAVLDRESVTSFVQSGEKSLQIHTRIVEYKDTVYLIAVNTKREQVGDIKWQIRGLKNAELEVLGENRTVKVKREFVKDNFKPLEVHVYSWDKSGNKPKRHL